MESVTRIGLHIDFVTMYLCNEEDKDNKMYFCYACFMGYHEQGFYYRSKDFLMSFRDLSSGHKRTN